MSYRTSSYNPIRLALTVADAEYLAGVLRRANETESDRLANRVEERLEAHCGPDLCEEDDG